MSELSQSDETSSKALKAIDLSRLKLLIDGYIRNIHIHKIHASSDIIKLIAIYFGQTQNAFIWLWQQGVMELIDIHNNTKYGIDLYFISNDDEIIFNLETFDYNFVHNCPHYLSQQSSLPLSVWIACKRRFGNNLCSDKIFSSNKWSLFFKLGETTSSITAFHSEFESRKVSYDEDGTLRKGLEDEFKYGAFNICIPSPESVHKDDHSFIYNPTEQTLYRPQGKQILALNLNQNPDNVFSWETWQTNMKTEFNGHGSICMVDRDRFMAVINAKDRDRKSVV